MPIAQVHIRTLILDDEKPIVHILALVCEKQGHVVLPFCDSADAFITLASAPIDLLITCTCPVRRASL